MDGFVKIIALSLITVILCLVLSRQNKDVALILSIAGCVMAAGVGFSYLSPVLSFFDTLTGYTQLDSNMLGVLLKAAGVGILGEITALLCSDAGNTAIGKVIQLASGMVILWISLPLYEGLLELIQKVMEGL